MTDDVWHELGSAMRQMRRVRNLSLRQLEAEGRWSRGTMSQVENGKSRPSAALVWWYEEVTQADGLLINLYTTARIGPQDVREGRRPVRGTVAEFSVLESAPPGGAIVRPESSIPIWWQLRNDGHEVWDEWSFTRMGAAAGPGLIGGGPTIDLPRVETGERVRAHVDATAPDRPGTTVAFWALVDASGRVRSASDRHLAVTVVVTDL